MANNNSSGSMTFTSRTAVALWVNEICGQISDGMWENASPHNHWQFWCRLDVSVGSANELKSTAWCVKNKYALTRLHQEKFNENEYVLRDRMLACGRLCKAGADPTNREVLHASEYMPATLEEFRSAKAAGTWKHDFIAKYMANVSDELAVAYYATTYTLKEMNADLKLIMSVMHTART